MGTKDQDRHKAEANVTSEIAQEISANSKKIFSKDLENDLQNLGIENKTRDKEFKENDYREMALHAWEAQKGFESETKNAYHNFPHELEVAFRVLKFFEDVDDPNLRKDMPLIFFAALYHDADHFGKTARVSPDGLSNEEHAIAVVADKEAKNVGFSVNDRVIIHGLIISTTFENKEIKPDTELEKLLVAADLGGVMKDIDEWLIESGNVALESKDRPKSVQEFIKGRIGFLNYLEESSKTNEYINKFLGVHITRQREALDVIMVDNNGENHPVLKEIIQRMSKS
jgi:hypothetical protein